jgi:hypothetical protein
MSEVVVCAKPLVAPRAAGVGDDERTKRKMAPITQREPDERMNGGAIAGGGTGMLTERHVRGRRQQYGDTSEKPHTPLIQPSRIARGHTGGGWEQRPDGEERANRDLIDPFGAPPLQQPRGAHSLEDTAECPYDAHEGADRPWGE